MRYVIPLFLAASLAGVAHAHPPGATLSAYRDEAARATPGFAPSARRGGEFFVRRFGNSQEMPNCASCHTDDPMREGRHVVTDKRIKPLAPAANAARFTDPAKTEKWFRRNCKEVVGRECSAAEKADFIAFLLEVQ